jgi:tRNA dimethylallyltransferase
MSNYNKIIVILGPTSSGKSDVAIKLARKFGGEIISADSRQIYRGMDIGSGKITKEEQKMAKHYMLDIVNPQTNFSAGQFKKKAEKIIADILKRNKIPIICGGTGFWIKSLVDNIQYPEVKPDWKLRKKLEEKSLEDLLIMLQKMDPERARTVDVKNKVRLIRAIEICKSLGKVPVLPQKNNLENKSYHFLQIGITMPKEKLHERIKKRLDQRFKQGMIEEVEKLHFQNKVSWKRLESFGLEYRQIALYLQNKVSENAMKDQLFQESKNYAKRQMTWFKKDKKIKWLENYKEIENTIRLFLNKFV